VGSDLRGATTYSNRSGLMKQFDWTVHEGSRIDRMPRMAQPVALVVRNLLRKPGKQQIPSPADYHHHFDGMATRHNDGFRQDARFRKAYERGVSAAGWDYGIPYRIHQALWCSRQAQKVEGDFVELGTGRGFIMSAVLADFSNWDSSSRSLYLFDTFISTHPDEQGRQISTDLVSQPHAKYYATSVDDVKMNFSEWPRVHIRQGDVFDTLPSLDTQRVALLHIDLNFYKPEIYGLRTLWDRIPRGGVVLLDDYAFARREAQYVAMNELAEELKFDILSTPTGQGIIIK
jgi:hypothetical protein